MRRALIVLIAVVWGGLVFLPGSVLVKTAAQRAALALLPLIIPLFLLNDHEKRWRKHLRWAYAILLALFGIIVLGGLRSIPYFCTAMIVMWPEIRGFLPQGRLKSLLTGSSLVLGLLGSFIAWQWFHNPLPSDEQLIEHFHNHHAEFEQLEQGYRKHRGSHFYENSSQDVLVLMKKAGVNHIVEAGGSFSEWFPEPYSEHTLQVLKSRYIRLLDGAATQEKILKIYQREFPEWFEKISPVYSLHDISKSTTPVKFYLGPDPTKLQWGKSTLRYPGSFLLKGFCHYPQSPRVENGHILNANYSLKENTYTRPGLRVLESLDNYPPDWKRGECVLKRIDDHWFISMCRSAV